jgi:hypothetical protein
VTSYLTEKLSKLRSFDRKQRRPQNCPFQSFFSQRTAQFTQGIPQCPQCTSRQHDDIIPSTSVSSNSFSRRTSDDTLLSKYSTFYVFFSDNIMADVASKRQTTALFLSTIITSKRIHTELTKKRTNLMGNLCCAKGQISFSSSFFYTVNL